MRTGQTYKFIKLTTFNYPLGDGLVSTTGQFKYIVWLEIFEGSNFRGFHGWLANLEN